VVAPSLEEEYIRAVSPLYERKSARLLDKDHKARAPNLVRYFRNKDNFPFFAL
jgi:hypothetical protein